MRYFRTVMFGFTGALIGHSMDVRIKEVIK